MLTLILLLVVAAFILTCIAAAGKVPLWAPVLILCVIEILRVLPVR